jgi:vancomycin resistance protein YoaR
MRTKSFMVVAGLLVVLLALAGATLAYDSGRKDTIAKGITVSGVDVGGLKRAAAEQKLTQELGQPLEQPVTVHFHGRRYQVNPQNLSVVVDVRRSVDEALERSREGGIFGRTVRNLTGGKVRADLDVAVDYDHARLDKRVRRLAKHVERPAKDADVDIGTAGVEVVRSQRGLKVDSGALSRNLTQVLTTADAVRDVKVPARFVKPKVTTKEVAKKYPKII